jgi:molecular chaperone DnaK
LAGDVKDVLLLDVTPLSLGIETLGGVLTKLIERNTTIPTKAQQVFSTAADNQPQVEIRVLQGEREMAADNREIGRFILDGIPPSPRGVPQVEVTFDMDANGILAVAAIDKASGKEQSIRIEGSGGLDTSEIDRMVKDAEANASDDASRRDNIEKKNQLDSLIYQAEKTIAENAAKMEDADKASLEAALTEARADLDSDDGEKLTAAREKVEAELHKIAEKLYKTEAAGQEGAAPPSGESGKSSAHTDDDVIDAEFTQENDDS